MDRKRSVVHAQFSSYLLTTYPHAQTTQLILSLLQGNALLTATFCVIVLYPTRTTHQRHVPQTDKHTDQLGSTNYIYRDAFNTRRVLFSADASYSNSGFPSFPQHLPRKGWIVTSNYNTPLPSTSLRTPIILPNLLPETVTTFLNTL